MKILYEPSNAAKVDAIVRKLGIDLREGIHKT